MTNSATNTARFRSTNREPAAVAAADLAGDPVHALFDSLLQSLEGGEMHVRPPLELRPDSPFLPFLETGLALRDCLLAPERRDYLIARLKPHAGLIVGALPASIQAHGMLPKLDGPPAPSYGFRPLEAISDEEVRDWLIEDGGLIFGELKRYELENYFDVLAPHLRARQMGSMDALGTMVDLGSGLGKVVMSTALTFPFARCVGVELLPYRHRLAAERRDRLLAQAASALAALPESPAPDTALHLPGGGAMQARHLLELDARIDLLEGDMFQLDVSDASLVFIYSTCFGPLMDAIADKLARELPQHALVSTTTYALNHPAFRLVEQHAPGTVAWTSVMLYERVGALDDMSPAPPRYRYEPDAALWEQNVRQIFSDIDASRSA